ncbi:MAG: NADH-quinone oxidoreductase subunit NuoK [Deltaproteobacteria bacterium CG11_big_fil_rev_8_21_14_0_20_45_16]|nr:MAG: NADH-quinone oxidoreductase subunit NuoK [Deltaproteobacteria bacterium CG11_big_fil_rev_8_21_14_0_20_45_16]
MVDVSIAQLLFVSFAIFSIGAGGFLIRKNAISLLICLELMLNAVNIAFVSFSRLHNNESGTVLYFFVITVAACETAVGLAIVLNLFRLKKNIRIQEANALRG